MAVAAKWEGGRFSEQLRQDCAEGQEADDGDEIHARASIAPHGGDDFYGVGGHQKKDDGQDRTAQIIDEVEGARVENGGNPNADSDGNQRDSVYFFLAPRVGEGGAAHDADEAFAGSHVMPEKRFCDCYGCDDRRDIVQHRVVKGGGHVSQHRDIRLFCLGELRWFKCHGATENEKNHDENDQRMGDEQNAVDAGFRAPAVFAFLRKHHGRNDGRVIERKNHDWDDEKHGNESFFGALRGGMENPAVPVRNQKQRKEQNRGDKRENQKADGADDDFFAVVDQEHQENREDRGQEHTRDGG